MTPSTIHLAPLAKVIGMTHPFVSIYSRYGAHYSGEETFFKAAPYGKYSTRCAPSRSEIWSSPMNVALEAGNWGILGLQLL